MLESEPPETCKEQWLAGCGYWIRHGDGWSLFVGAKKGGLVRLHSASAGPKLDHGWRLGASRGGCWTTNWWNEALSIEPEASSIVIQGPATRTRYHVPSPVKHIVLRCLAWMFRHRLIPLLKKMMIFRSGSPSGPRFTRTVTITSASVRIEDQFTNLPSARKVHRSPFQNLRHVASADSFSAEEWAASSAPDSFVVEWKF
jgi:hypothetical protein